MKYFFIIFALILLFIAGCENENSIVDEETSDTVSLSPQEVFALTLTEDILNEDDEDLRLFLEEDIYPLVSKSQKVTIDRFSSSQYIISYSQNDTLKEIVIRKFYNPVSDIIEFTKK